MAPDRDIEAEEFLADLDGSEKELFELLESPEHNSEEEEFLADLDESEKELFELLESPEHNSEEIHTEIEALFDLTRNAISRYYELVSMLEVLTEDMESKAERVEQLSERRENITDRLGLNETDE